MEVELRTKAYPKMEVDSIVLVKRQNRGMNMESVKLRIEYFLLRLRDKLGIPFKPGEEIKKINIKAGQTILDYGCGIGSFTFPAARLVGEKGKVYALDKQPLIIGKIKERAQKEGFHNRVLKGGLK